MDIGKSFTFMFDDEKWVQKLVIGGLLALVSIIPLVNIFTGLVLAGYTLRVLINVAKGTGEPLPEWDDWGGDWVRGLMVTLGCLIYSIPAILVSGFTGIVSSIADSGYGYSGSSDFAGVCIAGVSCLGALWSLAEFVVLPAAILRYAEDEEFGSFFKFGDIFKFIGDNLSNYIVALLLIVVANFVSVFGTLVCVIGLFFANFWATLVSAHLLGQVKADASPAAATASASASAAAYGELDASAISRDEDEE